MAQHKQSYRKSLRSALAHRKLADEILDNLKLGQDTLNSVLDKLDLDDAATLDADYEATLAISSIFESDDEGLDAQHKQSLRKSLRSALAHRKLADEMMDALEELHVAINALLVKLDADSITNAGVLTDTNYAALLALDILDAEASLSDAQHKASVKKSLRSALAHKKLADALLSSIRAVQDAFNASLAQLDAGNVNGAHAALKIESIDPDSY
jgi:hypothetical protein